MARKPSTHRKDRNHDDVVAVAERYGWQVLSLTSAGGGIPDLLVWRWPQGFRLVEVKAGKGSRLTVQQQQFRARYSMPVVYVSSLEGAERAFQPSPLSADQE